MKFTRVDLLLLLMVIFWGANITIIKVAIRNFHPVVFNAIRFLIASSVMLVIYRKSLKTKLTRNEILLLIALGLLGNTVYQFLFIYGVKLTQVTNTSILLGTTPIFTAAVSSLLGFEEVRRMLWLGVLCSFAGVLLIVFGRSDIHHLSANLGDFFILICSLLWSLYTAFSRNIVKHHSAMLFVLYTVCFGTVGILIPSLPFFFSQDWEILAIGEWAAVVYSALLALVFGYSAWYYAVGKIGGARTSAYSNLTPVAGMFWGMLLLGERLMWLQWIGAGVIFLGLLLCRLESANRDANVSVAVE